MAPKSVPTTMELYLNLGQLVKDVGKIQTAVENLDKKVDDEFKALRSELKQDYATQKDLDLQTERVKTIRETLEGLVGDNKKLIYAVLVSLIGAIITFFFAFAQRGIGGGS